METLVVYVTMSNYRAHYPTGSWWLVVVVDCGGEDGPPQPIRERVSLSLLLLLSLSLFLRSSLHGREMYTGVGSWFVKARWFRGP